MQVVVSMLHLAGRFAWGGEGRAPPFLSPLPGSSLKNLLSLCQQAVGDGMKFPG